jgi:nucleotide-binding universal stress UspA family protein
MRIAVGFIRTEEGMAALDAARREAVERDATLVVVHSMRGGERHEDEIAAEHDRALTEIEAELRDEGIAHDIKRFARGATPSEDLLQCAHDEDVDMIVIGIRRRSPVGKLLLGSNAQDIILHADCPVLAVKP